MIHSKTQMMQEPISLRGCAGWSAPLLFANPEDRTGFLPSRPKCFKFFYMTMLQQDIGSKRQITMTTEADSIAGMGKLSYSAC